MKRKASPAGVGAAVTLLAWIVFAVLLGTAFAFFPTLTAWAIMTSMVVAIISPLVRGFIAEVK